MSNPLQYPISDIRNSTDGPNGWNFHHVDAFKSLDSQWYFIPWEKVKVVKATAGELASKLHAQSTVNAEKLVVCCAEPVRKQFRGSGIVVNERNSSIIGCYKSMKHTDHGHLLIEIKETEL
jgi:hypothetical protein